MTVRTSSTFLASPSDMWPLLYRSKMDGDQPCYFLCGLPKPLECRLPGETGGVGGTRECVSDKGVIRQRITEWEPAKKLSFELVQTDIYFGPCVESIVENFELAPAHGGGTVITRTTHFRFRKSYGVFAAIPMCIGLKAIHRYVFRNWRRLSVGNMAGE